MSRYAEGPCECCGGTAIGVVRVDGKLGMGNNRRIERLRCDACRWRCAMNESAAECRVRAVRP